MAKRRVTFQVINKRLYTSVDLKKEEDVKAMGKESINRLQEKAEHIYCEWDRALSENDTEALLALYAPDATLESPLIPYLLNCEIGICKGREALRILIQKVAERKPPLRKYYRKRFFTDGDTLMWEYPRSTPTGEQMDFVEVMELKNGLIWYHRVYWGWLGVKVIKEDQYRR